jgi:hypothetical protein
MDPQYTAETIYGRATSKSKVFTSYCYDGNFNATVYRERTVQLTPSELINGTFPDPSWELQMRLKIKDTSVNLASSFAEFGETVGMLKQFANIGFEIYRDVRHGHFDRLIRRYGQWQNIPAAILALNFGVKPLAKDIADSCAALSKKAEAPIVKRFHVKANDSKEETSGIVDYSWKTTKYVTLYVEYDPVKWTSITLGNPLEWAWEVIPFSFIVDQMIPIGDWLSSLDALKSVKSTIGTVTTKREYKAVEHPTGYDSIDVLPTYSYKEHKRAVVSGVPIPPLPTYKPSGSLMSVLNDLSVLALLRR